MKSPLSQALLRLLPGLAILTGLTSTVHAAAETELKDAAGATIIRYVVEPPGSAAPAGTSDPAKQLGLILCFPEHDRPTGDEILPVREALNRLGLRDGYVLLAGHPQSRKFGPADDQPIEKLIEWALKTYPINPRRIYMYGKGEGGKISGEFAMLHPSVVTAGITYSWGWWRMPAETTKAIEPFQSAPEFYMVLGLRDLSYHLTTVRDAYARVSAKGYNVIYREFEELGARTYHPPSNDDGIAWATRLRNKNLPLSPGEQKLLARFAGKNLPAAGPSGYYEDLAIVGGVPAGEALRKLLDSPNAEVRAAAARTYSHGIFGEPAVEALAAKVSDSSAKVRTAAIGSLALLANWRSQAAQHALIELATNPGKAVDPVDRVGAVDGLVRAVRLQINGVRQDPDMFRALVALLQDQNEELRVMAANTLAPIRDREFRGDLGRPERKEPNGGWDRWLEETSAKAAGYRHDYEACGKPAQQGSQEALNLFCTGGGYLLGFNPATRQSVAKNPELAFQTTLKAAELGYAPAQAAVAMMYANAKGVPQSYPEAAKWWVKAADGGHLLAAQHAVMLYRGSGGVKADAEISARLNKLIAAHAAGAEPSSDR